MEASNSDKNAVDTKDCPIKANECFALPTVVFHALVLVIVLPTTIFSCLAIYFRLSDTYIINKAIGTLQYIEEGEGEYLAQVPMVSIDGKVLVGQILWSFIIVLILIIVSIIIVKKIVKLLYKYRIKTIEKYRNSNNDRIMKKGYVKEGNLFKRFDKKFSDIITLIMSFSLILGYIYAICIYVYGLAGQYLNRFNNIIGYISTDTDIVNQYIQNNIGNQISIYKYILDNIEKYYFNVKIKDMIYLVETANINYIVTILTTFIVMATLPIMFTWLACFAAKGIKRIFHYQCPICTVYRKLDLQEKNCYNYNDIKLEEKEGVKEVELRDRHGFLTGKKIYVTESELYNVETIYTSDLYKCSCCGNNIYFEKSKEIEEKVGKSE